MSTMSIAEFYASKNVFITGGTGFIGKVLIEKLLRSCPDVARVYLLVRPKRGKDRQARVDALVQSQVFDELRKQQPSFADKIVAINGDMMEKGLGISDADKLTLINNVNIVFHSAATIRFDEHIRQAVQMNIIGVRCMIQLCKSLKHLEVFVHVSTAYANVDRDVIDEVFYPSPIEPQNIIDALDMFDDDTLEAMTPKLIGKQPNTYTYTKQLAETLLMKEGSDLPVAVVRPSIVTASWKEPFPGWIDNLNGPSAFYVATGKGVLRSIVCSHDGIADILPVDIAANMLLAVAWHTAVNKPDNALIYQHTTGSTNPVTWGDMMRTGGPYFRNISPLENAFRRPKMGKIFTSSRFLHDVWVVFSHWMPAVGADVLSMMFGQKPRMVNLYKKLHKGIEVLMFFTVRSWDWTHEGMDTLLATMTDDDREKFSFNTRDVNWPAYVENYCAGVKKYILKEDPANIPKAKAHLKKLMMIRYTFNSFVAVFTWWLLKSRSTVLHSAWFYVMGLLSRLLGYMKLVSS